MSRFGFEEMQAIQKELQEKYREKWGELTPEKGASYLLWMIVEAGEVADIVKKEGNQEILKNPETRRRFVEELCDVMMYFNDLMLIYGIQPEELESVYREKHRRNMSRW